MKTLKILISHFLVQAMLLTGFSSVSVLAVEADNQQQQEQTQQEQQQQSYEEASADQRAAHRASLEGSDKQSKERSGKDLEDVKMGWEQYLSILNALVIGFVTASLIKSCKKFSTDMMLAAAGGVAYIYAEVSSTIKDKKARDDIEEAYKDDKKNGNNGQVAALEAEKESYEEIAKTAEDKAKVQKIAAAAFAAASVVGITKSIALKTAEGNCLAGIGEVEIEFSAVCSAACADPTGSQCAACNAEMAKCMPGAVGKQTSVTANVATQEAPATSAGKSPTISANDKTSLTAFTAACTGPYGSAVTAKAQAICGLVSGALDESLAVCVPGMMGVLSGNTRSDYMDSNEVIAQWVDMKVESDSSINKNMNSEEKGLLAEAMKRIIFGIDYLVPTANASMMNYLGLGAAGLGVFMGLKGITSKTLDLWISTPGHRAIVFGAMAASVFIAANASDKIADQARGNAGKLAGVIANAKGTQDATQIDGTGQVRQELNPIEGMQTDKSLRDLTDVLEKPICATKLVEGKCPNFPEIPKEDKTILDGFGGANFSSNLMGFANEVNGAKGISEKGSEFANSLNGKGAIAMKNLRKTRDEMLKRLKENDPIDHDNFLAMEKGFEDMMKMNMMNELKKHGQTPQSYLASIGKGDIPGTSSKKVADKDSKLTGGKGSLGSIGRVNIPVPKKKGWKLNMNFDEEGAGTEVAALDPNAVEEGMEGSKNEDDILENRGEDLFKVITKRYMKTAYPVLLEEL